jgi:hypothetical protein
MTLSALYQIRLAHVSVAQLKKKSSGLDVDTLQADGWTMRQDLHKPLLYSFAKNAYKSQESFNFETCLVC